MTEQSLHEQLKDWYAGKIYPVEASVDNYIIDVLMDDLLVEIQTGSFNTIKPKLYNLLKDHKVRLVHPIPYMKWIIRLNSEGQRIRRRKSPKKGRVEEIFYELVYIPGLCRNKNFELEIVLANIEEYWINDGKGSWRRGNWSIHDRKLLHVHESRIFREPYDFLPLIPPRLSKEFTSRELQRVTGLTKSLSQKMIYSLRKMGVLKLAGKKGRAYLYSISS